MNKRKIKNLIVLILIATLFGFSIAQAQKIPQIPEDIRNQVPEKDLLEVFCLMSKWKTGEFFAALDGLNEVLIPALNELQTMGMEVNIPDISSYRSQGQAKLNVICSAPNYEAAQAAVQDFINFGETVKQELSSLNSSLALAMKTQGDEMRAKVESEINAWAEQERIKIEQELKAKADQLAAQMKASLEQEMAGKEFTTEEEAMAYANSRAAQMKATIEAQINSLAEQKKKELEERANAKASEILGGDAEKFKAIGEKLQGIEQQINQVIEAKKQDYEKYRIQAMEKRKHLILAILDKNIEEARKQIREKEDLLKEAKLNDPSVKTADEYIAELDRDREILVEKIQAAIDNGDEAAINSAVEEIKNKWEGIRLDLEKDLAKRQTAVQICAQVVPQLSQAKPQIESGLTQIEVAQKEITEKKDECDVSETSLCADVETIFDKLSVAKEKAENLINQMNLAEQKCGQVTEETPLDEILELMLSLRESGPDFQKEMLALKTEWESKKTKLEEALSKKPKVKDICAENLPELALVKTQTKEGLVDIKGIRDNCQGNSKLGCVIVNSLMDDWHLIEKGENLLNKINTVENKCKGKTTLNELVALLKEIEKESKEFSLLVEDIKEFVKVEKEEKVYIEAENYSNRWVDPASSFRSGMKRTSYGLPPCCTLYPEGWWQFMKSDDILGYRFKVEQGGYYTLWIRDYSTPTAPPGARAITVMVDDKNYGSFSENSIRSYTRIEGCCDSGSWGWHKIISVFLTPGYHLLKIEKAKTTSAHALIDAYLFTNNPLVKP